MACVYSVLSRIQIKTKPLTGSISGLVFCYVGSRGVDTISYVVRIREWHKNR